MDSQVNLCWLLYPVKHHRNLLCTRTKSTTSFSLLLHTYKLTLFWIIVSDSKKLFSTQKSIWTQHGLMARSLYLKPASHVIPRYFINIKYIEQYPKTFSGRRFDNKPSRTHVANMKTSLTPRDRLHDLTINFHI